MFLSEVPSFYRTSITVNTRLSLVVLAIIVQAQRPRSDKIRNMFDYLKKGPVFNFSIAKVVAFMLSLLPFAMTLPLGAQSVDLKTWPTKPLHWIIPYAPGGLTDTTTRIITKKMMENTGWTIVIENRPGANGLIGSEYVARANPDGYHFMTVIAAHSVNPTLYAGTLNFDPLKSLTPISLAGITPLLISIPNSLPVKDLKELIAYAKANPGKISYGSSGIGSAAHMATELLRMNAELEMVHIPYKGAALALQDLIGNNIQILVDTAPTLMPHARNGKIKALAIMSSKRIGGASEVPTIVEAGGPMIDAATWVMFLTTTGVPKEIINRVALETQKAVNAPDIKALFETLGLEGVGLNPIDTAKFLDEEIIKMAKIIKAKNIKPE